VNLHKSNHFELTLKPSQGVDTQSMIDMNVATDVSIAIYDVEKGSCVIRILYHSGKDVNNIDLDVRPVVLKRRDF